MQFDAINQMCKKLNKDEANIETKIVGQKFNFLDENLSSNDPTPSVSPLLRKIKSHNASFEDLDLIEI